MSDTWKECEGQVVDGEFRLLEHRGGSDHSVVFLTERGKGKKAAIKFVQADAANAELQLSRWKRAAQLSHPNLIQLFETGRCHLAGMDLLYVVMEFAAENLAEFLPQRALTPAETRDMLEPFLETLAYLHGKGFLHGRIKPGNILAIDDQLKLSSDSLRRIGEVAIDGAKPDVYSPPESAEAREDSSPARDVWALGVTLVETLTQRAPDRAASQAANQGELPVADTVPQPFLDIARHCLQLAPQRRWTVTEISTRLNPPAKPPAPSISTMSVPDPIKPTAAKPAPGASAPAAAKPAKSAAAIDPLSIPLSPVAPLTAEKRHTLENQMIAGKGAPGRSYYVVVAVLIALTLGAVLAIPRFRNHQTDSEPPIAVATNQPDVQPSTPAASAKTEPPAPAKSLSKSQKQSAQRAAVQAPQQPAQNLLQPTANKEFVKRDQSVPAPAASAAPTGPGPSSAEPSSATPAAGPVTQGEALNQVLPEVSERSRSTIHGTVRVIIKVHVDPSGSVSSAEVASSPSKFFADSALQAARRWDFAPAKVAGQSVASDWLVRFDFTQSDTKVLPAQTKP